MYDPFLVSLMKMRPHDSQSSRENVTPFSGASSLASYKEVHHLLLPREQDVEFLFMAPAHDSGYYVI